MQGDSPECLLKATEKHFPDSQNKETQTRRSFATGRVNGECKVRDLRSWKLRASNESTRHPRVAFYMEEEGDDNSQQQAAASNRIGTTYFYMHDYVWESASNVYEAMGRFENLPRQGSLDEGSGLAVVKRIAIPSSCTRDVRCDSSNEDSSHACSHSIV